MVRNCIAFLNEKGLKEEGIYRIPGNKRVYTEYILRYNCGENLDFLEISNASTSQKTKKPPPSHHYIEPHDVCGVLLAFFKECKDSLFYDQKEQLLAIDYKSMSPEAKVEAMLPLLRKLPVYHYATLRLFIQHLLLVAKHHEENHMTVNNLLICICGLSKTSPVYFNLMENFEKLFDKPPEEHEKLLLEHQQSFANVNMNSSFLLRRNKRTNAKRNTTDCVETGEEHLQLHSEGNSPNPVDAEDSMTPLTNKSLSAPAINRSALLKRNVHDSDEESELSPTSSVAEEEHTHSKAQHLAAVLKRPTTHSPTNEEDKPQVAVEDKLLQLDNLSPKDLEELSQRLIQEEDTIHDNSTTSQQHTLL